MTAEIAASFQGLAGAGSVGAEADADLRVAIGRLARAVEVLTLDQDGAWPVEIPAHAITLTAGAGTLDIPNELGPNTGYFWAVEYVSAAGFTAGTVNVYLSTPDTVAQSNVRFPFTSAGVWEPGRTAAILVPGDRLVFVAAGITGNVVISGKVTQAPLRFLHRFLI